MAPMKRHARADDLGILPIIYRNPASPTMPVEVLRLTALRAKAPVSFFRRAHRADFLALLLADAPLTHRLDLRRVDLDRGDVLVIGPGQPHRFEATGGDGWLLLVSASLLERGLSRASSSPIHLGAHEPSLRVLLGELDAAQHETPSPRVRRRVHHLVHALLLSLPESETPHHDAASSKILTLFQDEVEWRFPTTRKVADYAVTTGYSVTTLDRATRKLLGVSAKAYIDARVLLEARRLLIHSALSVGQIGARLGFTEATNFAKFFRRTSGESTGAFRVRHGAV